jgi:hypothetical protein
MCAAEQRAAVKAAAATAIAALHAHRTQHNEHTCQLAPAASSLGRMT